ncbi:MAG TPA: MgtC/SapB family protein [Ktedonobacterales bacterium]|jgi:putative Mg2+ transporter-C (MgtC) family protein
MIAQEIFRLLAAAVLGAVIGFERERLDRGAGLRTHALVSTASALVMIVSSYGFTDVITADRTIVLDPSRIAAQVISGIGFLGAGLIILRKNTVYGLTTAASIWAVAAIGLAAGAGLYIPAAITTGILLLILSGLRPVEQRLFAHKRIAPFTVRISRQQASIGAIEASVRDFGMDIWQIQLRPGKKASESLIILELHGGRADSFSQLAERLHGLPGVREVSYGRQKQVVQHTELGEEEQDSG